jgi:hypothetical protein
MEEIPFIFKELVEDLGKYLEGKQREREIRRRVERSSEVEDVCRTVGISLARSLHVEPDPFISYCEREIRKRLGLP